ncbi:MAG: hypothetical protein Q7T03_10305 [Deltaproteobacteria bacterium]|nr:hypothetical protein [Deltaproteobacteria bacterium]
MSLGILAVAVAAGILLISVFFLMYGAATGLGTVFVDKPWLGWVITGGVFLSGPILFFTIHFSKPKKKPADFSKTSEALLQQILDATRKHPLQSTGAAAAAGFMVGGKEPSEITHALKEALIPILVEYIQSRQK